MLLHVSIRQIAGCVDHYHGFHADTTPEPRLRSVWRASGGRTRGSVRMGVVVERFEPAAITEPPILLGGVDAHDGGRCLQFDLRQFVRVDEEV